ncbi:UDPglucose 6-dehydrogenase [Saccharomonospora viridis]|nr:UDPglucose 6-dehydrogenase [Saccharomonospora viridis]
MTSAACLAHLGHRVTGVDIDADKVALLRRGEVPIAEPGLGELVNARLADGSLSFTTDLAGLATAEVVLLCVPTPVHSDGTTDLRAFDAAVETLSDVLDRDCVVVIKSTVPVGTTERTARALGRATVSNPEFLREGHAVHDFLNPDRIVIGATEATAADRVAALYEGVSAPVLRTEPASSELGKYASNAFLALKVSYVNVLTELSERLGAEVIDVAETMRLDPRIGTAFLSPGPGWGGSCLPKDTRALLHAAKQAGVDFAVLADAMAANRRQHERVVEKVREAVTGSPDGSLAGLRLGLLGLTFKAGTDDVRESPALAVAALLAEAGAVLTGYDPGVDRTADVRPVHVVDDPTLVAKDSAGLVLLTEWPQFRALDWAQLAELADRPTVVDARNLLEAEAVTRAGFAYHRLGR